MDSSTPPFLSPETVGVLAGAGVAIVLHLLNALIPRGHHFKFMDRFIRPDKPEEDTDDPRT